MNCVQWFRKAYPGVLAFHVPNGEKRDRRIAEKLQRMGVLPGVADWLVFDRAGMLAVEFKSKIGRAGDDQDAFGGQWTSLGGTFAIVRTLEEFQGECIALLGSPKVISAVPATDDEPAPLEIDEAVVRQMIAEDAAPLKMPWD